MMEDKALPNVLSGLKVNNDSFLRELKQKSPAATNYVIFFTPRSGSSWLTSVLSATRLLGFPEEYINPNFLRSVADSVNSVNPSGIIQILRRRRKTANDVFGIEITSTQLRLFGESAFFEAFDNSTVVFSLWRDNVVSQGISLYRAVSTQKFHSSDDKKTSVPPYDADEIEKWIKHIIQIENENVLALNRWKRYPYVIRYEDIVKNRTTTIRIFGDALRIAIPDEQMLTSSDLELRKIADEWNSLAETRFRNERRSFIDTVRPKRLMKQEP